MSDDLRKWLAYNPLDPMWDFPPARSALDAKTQAEIIILRYRDHHGGGVYQSAMWNQLSRIAEAVRNIPCSKVS